MRWLWFVGALICMAVVFRTHSLGLAALGLLGTLGCFVMGTLALVSGRIDSRSRDSFSMVDQNELRRMREQIDQRKREGEGSAVAGSASVASARSRDPDDLDLDSVSADPNGSGND